MDIRNQRAGAPLSARQIRDMARTVDRSVIRSPGARTTPGGTNLAEDWSGWSPFIITFADPLSNAYSAVEASLDYVPAGSGPGTAPYAAALDGGRTADHIESPCRALGSGVTFNVNDLVLVRPSRSRPGEWEAIPCPGMNSVTLPYLVYCDGNENLKVIYICLTGFFTWSIGECHGSSSSSSSTS